MSTYRFFERVIMSCTNHEQLQSCIQWLNTADIPSVLRPAVLDLIRVKAKELSK